MERNATEKPIVRRITQFVLVPALLLSLALSLAGCGYYGSKARNNASEQSKTEDMVYKNEEAGFSADFSGKPKTETSSYTMPGTNERLTRTFFKSQKSTSSTTYEVTIVDVEDLGQTGQYLSALGPEQQKETMDYLLDTSFLSALKRGFRPKEALETVYATRQGFPCISAVAPFECLNEDGSKAFDTYGYVMCLIANDKAFLLAGSRATPEEAQQALDSFKLL